VFHGLLRGLPIVVAARDGGVTRPSPTRAEYGDAAPTDLVHVLANLVLKAHTQVRHVY